jgi:superfamily I DNA and/or RNA helicase
MEVKQERNLRKLLNKYTELQDARLQEFCNSIDLIDGEGDYIAQRRELHTEISAFLAGAVDNAQIDSLIALVQDKALPDNKGEIIREDILKRLGVTSERDLFPAPQELEKFKNFIKREQHEILLNSVLELLHL